MGGLRTKMMLMGVLTFTAAMGAATARLAEPREASVGRTLQETDPVEKRTRTPCTEVDGGASDFSCDACFLGLLGEGETISQEFSSEGAGYPRYDEQDHHPYATENPSVWMSFTSGVDQCVQVEVVLDGEGDSVLSLFRLVKEPPERCSGRDMWRREFHDTFVRLGGDDDGGADKGSMMTGPAVAGETYFVMVNGFFKTMPGFKAEIVLTGTGAPCGGDDE